MKIFEPLEINRMVVPNRIYVPAYDASGRPGPPSNSVTIAPPVPDYAGAGAGAGAS